MGKEAWAAVVATAFSVALTVTPGLQSWYVAVPAWAVTAWAIWRWYGHYRKSEAAASSFDGKFFRPPESRVPWLTIDVGAYAFSHLPKDAAKSLSVPIHLINRHPTRKVSLAFSLEEDGKVLRTAEGFQMIYYGYIPPPASLGQHFQDLHSPVAVGPQEERRGILWFVTQDRFPLSALVIKDNISGQVWKFQIDPEVVKGPKNAGY